MEQLADKVSSQSAAAKEAVDAERKRLLAAEAAADFGSVRVAIAYPSQFRGRVLVSVDGQVRDYSTPPPIISFTRVRPGQHLVRISLHDQSKSLGNRDVPVSVSAGAMADSEIQFP
jgi:hypothetical protein